MNDSVVNVEQRHAIVNMSTVDRWASVVLGASLVGATARKSPFCLRSLLGMELVRRGLTGHCFAYQAFGVRSKPLSANSHLGVPYELGVRARAAITIAKPREQVYQFWQDLENLPRFVRGLRSVTRASDTDSHWVFEGPGGTLVQWDATLHNEVANELIAWRSLPGSQVDSAGSVHFRDASGGRGTEIVVRMQYNPPAGFIGAAVARIFGTDVEGEIEAGLSRIKQFLECGEVATVQGQPTGASKSHRPAREPQEAANQPEGRRKVASE